MGSGTRRRIVDAGAGLMRRQGVTGTGLKTIGSESGASLGSIYHFFPGGKDQLTEEVIRTAGGLYGDLVIAVLAQHDEPLTAVRAVFDGAAHTLIATDFADACPIATIALEVASTHEGLRRATAEVFTSWIDAGTEHFRRWGADPEAARSLSIGLIASLEGAFVLARATRSVEPLAAAGAAVRGAVAGALRR